MESPSTRIGRFAYYVFRLVHLTINNVLAIPTYVVWCMILFPVKKLNPGLYWSIEALLFKALLSYVVMWAHSGGYKLIESGDDLSSLHDKRILLLLNHQSTGDIFCAMSMLQPRSLVIGQVMWIMDYMFLYTNFGVCSYLHHDFFIQQGKESRGGQLEKLRDHMLQHYLVTNKRWIMLFPEGGFLHKRREANHKYAKKNDLPILSHVTFPRLGAIETILNSVRTDPQENASSGDLAPGKKVDTNVGSDRVTWVVDVTVAYPNGEPLDFVGMMIGWWQPCHMLVHYRAYRLSDIPADTEGRTTWLYDRWVEKETMLEGYYKEKKFLDESDHEKRVLPGIQRGEVPFDKRWLVAAYAFYTASAYIFWLYIYCPIWCMLTYLVSLIF